jgi:trigger factor
LDIEKQIQDDHQARLIVNIDPDRLETAKHRAARKLSERGKIPGFRPGKAPYEMIRRQYGDEAIYERAVDLLVDELYPEVLKEADIHPAAAGSLENIEGTETPRFTFLVPLSPAVELGDYRSLRLSYDFKGPGPEKLQEAIDELRQMYATTETVERAVQEGDYVLVDVKAGKESLTRNGAAVAVRAADQENEWPFPGFARQLMGLQAGETRKLSHTFAADFPDPALAGEAVELEAQVKTVQAVTLPEVDDDFARLVGQFENLDRLKEALTKDIDERTRADYDDEYFTRLIDKIKEGASVKYAPQTLAHEAEHVVDDLRQRLAQQGLDLETYYKMRKTDAAKFLEEEARPVAARRLERSLILDEIARRESIAVDDSALDQEFTETLTSLQRQGVDLARVRGGKQGQQQLAQAVAMESAGRLLTRRTLERLKSIATGEAGEPAEADQLVEKPSPAGRKKSEKGSGSRSAGKAGRNPASKNPKTTGKKSKDKKEEKRERK